MRRPRRGAKASSATRRSCDPCRASVLATLLAEAWQPLRARDYHACSGKRCIVIMRPACHLRRRTAVSHWARTATQHDELSRRRYAELRKRGHSHGRALRTVGDRLRAVACAMLSQQTLFDPNRRHARQPEAA